ncbi:hypothetical protein LSAT2_022825 [Lamellibrachia satsuma]|nr:hypothetical protein LSAT2_022825 [Lamellibrachia satsuma]
MRNLGVLVLFVVAYGCSDAFLFGSECAGVEYNNNVICCGDKLYLKTAYTRCCFGEIMDTRLHVCFFGKIPNPFSNCNGQYFDIESSKEERKTMIRTELVIYNMTSPSRSKMSLRCEVKPPDSTVGSSVSPLVRRILSEYNVLPKPGLSTTAGTYRMRNFGVLVLLVVAYGCSDAFLFGSECAGVEYDDNTMFCCGDKLYEKTEYSECCFGEMIDTRLYACFFGKLPNPFSSTYLVQHF